MKLRFRLATPDDDAALRHAFTAAPMEGGMRLVFEREPSFFDAVRVQGSFVQVIVCEDTETGAIAALGTRAISDCFIQGVPTPTGYLSDLRVLPAYRNRTVLARGWKFFRELDSDGRTSLYQTVIFSENSSAQSALVGGRAGAPVYHPWGKFITAGLHPSRRKNPTGTCALRVTRGEAAALPSIIEFLNREHARWQFAPVHRQEDFAPGGRWRGLEAEDFFLVWDGTRLCGAAATWDQSSFKQTRVLGYAGRWRWLYRLSRLLHRFAAVPQLPMPGALFHFGYGSFVAIENDEVPMFQVLVQAMREEASRRGWLHLLLALHERHPLFPALKQMPHTAFHANLYLIDPRQPGVLPGDNGIPQIEAALL